MVECPFCGMRSQPVDVRCQYCHKKLFVAVPREAATARLKIAGLILALTATAFGLFLFGSKSDNPAESLLAGLIQNSDRFQEGKRIDFEKKVILGTGDIQPSDGERYRLKSLRVSRPVRKIEPEGPPAVIKSRDLDKRHLEILLPEAAALETLGVLSITQERVPTRGNGPYPALVTSTGSDPASAQPASPALYEHHIEVKLRTSHLSEFTEFVGSSRAPGSSNYSASSMLRSGGKGGYSTTVAVREFVEIDDVAALAGDRAKAKFRWRWVATAHGQVFDVAGGGHQLLSPTHQRTLKAKEASFDSTEIFTSEATLRRKDGSWEIESLSLPR